MRSLVLVMLGAAATPAFANAVVEKGDRVEIDYSAQKVRFYGESTLKPEEGADAAKQAEKRARADAEKVLSFRPAERPSSYVTNYYADGTVRVYLETALTVAVPKDVTFARKDRADASGTSSTGVLFALDKNAKPAATYQVVDEAGAVVFEAKDMAEDAFRQGLMGRWLKNPSEKDLAAVVGVNPVRVPLISTGPGRFKVSRGAWDEAMKGSRPNLINGQVALLIP